jgi:nucleotide-binding universal stress UspA family protein
MLPFKRILFPVDYSEPCRAIVPWVRDMTQHYSADLTVVHAYGPEALAFSKLAINDPNLPAEAHAAEQDRLRAFAAESFPGTRVEAIVEQGEPAMALHKIVQRHGADLVMLATRGHGPVRRLLVGSITAKVLHDVSAAVWTGVGSELAGHRPSVPYKSILCAVDETSEEAEAVVTAGAAFAKSYGARLSLLHVVETPPLAVEVNFAAFQKEIMEGADLRLQDLKKRLDVEAQHSVREGGVAEGIRQEALECKADLVFVGRGLSQGTLSRIWSRLYAIVRESPCPVLSI